MDSNKANQLIELNKNSYEKIAEQFSETRFFPWTEIENAVQKYIKPGNKILDLGCGNGRLLKSLEKTQNFSYVGLDNCSALIKKAQSSFLSSQAPFLSFPQALSCPNGKLKRESRNVFFICGNILDLSQFTDNKFDVVFMVASFHHIPNKKLREKLLQDIKRILKPGGFLIMTNWNLWQIGAKKSIWSGVMSFRGPRQAKRCRRTRNPVFNKLNNILHKDILIFWQNKFPLYYHAFTLAELKKILRQAEFKILENYYVKQGKKARWWNGYNILTITQKQ